MAPGKNSPAAPDFITVPGGVVFIDIYRDQEPFTFWAKNLAQAALNPYAANHVKRDIVIQREDRSRELYREGPYDVRTVVRPLNSILREIEASGLESFLERRRGESSEVQHGDDSELPATWALARDDPVPGTTPLRQVTSGGARLREGAPRRRQVRLA